jgi:hypothetical protein
MARGTPILMVSAAKAQGPTNMKIAKLATKIFNVFIKRLLL